MKKINCRGMHWVFIALLAVAISLLTACPVVSGAGTETTESGENPRIKNVIFFIGDGMGPQHRRIAGIFQGKGDPAHRLALENLKTSGIAYNHSLNALVTDSAASGTALATGYKTNSGYIAMDPQGNQLKTILELCRDNGKSTGLITTVTIAHATPAAFAAHVNSRKKYSEIALQYLDQGVDLLMGGGWNDFLPPAPAGQSVSYRSLYGKRKDHRNLVEDFQNKGYTFVHTRDGLMSLDTGKAEKLLGLFAPGAMAYEIDRDPSLEPHIAEMTAKAIEVLSRNPQGFFLMVEGGKIDWAGHGHDVAGVVHDTIAMDDAVKVALKFAEKNPDTLIVVVEDHETGGLAITANTSVERIGRLKATAERMAGMIRKDGSNIREVFETYAGIADLKDWEYKKVRDEVTGVAKYFDKWGYGGSVVADIISQRTGVHFSTGGHTGAPVLVAVQGPGCEIFDGFYDQTDIPRKIAELLGLELP